MRTRPHSDLDRGTIGYFLAVLFATGCALPAPPEKVAGIEATQASQADYASRAAIGILRAADTFLDVAVGYGGITPLEVFALRHIAQSEDAASHFERLATESQNGAATRLYGLCGLRGVDPARYDAAVDRWRPRTGRVEYQWGCVVRTVEIRQFLEPHGDLAPLLHTRATEMLAEEPEPDFDRATADAVVALAPEHRIDSHSNLDGFLVHPRGEPLLRNLLQEPTTNADNLEIALAVFNQLGSRIRELTPLLESRLRGEIDTPTECVRQLASTLVDACLWQEGGLARSLEWVACPDLSIQATVSLLAQLGYRSALFAEVLGARQAEQLLVVERIPDELSATRAENVRESMSRWGQSTQPCRLYFPRSVPPSTVARLVAVALTPDDPTVVSEALVVAGATAAKALADQTLSGDLRIRRTAADLLQVFLARPSTWAVITPAMRALREGPDRELSKFADLFLDATNTTAD